MRFWSTDSLNSRCPIRFPRAPACPPAHRRGLRAGKHRQTPRQVTGVEPDGLFDKFISGRAVISPVARFHLGPGGFTEPDRMFLIFLFQIQNPLLIASAPPESLSQRRFRRLFEKNSANLKGENSLIPLLCLSVANPLPLGLAGGPILPCHEAPPEIGPNPP